jgi:pimeloyl-ACP methyl ester carboxylesterase
VRLHHNTIDANGYGLHYVTSGDGAPMVLLHGDSASWLDWKWALPGLAARWRVHCPDLPGHGDSGRPAAPYSPRLFTDIVIAFLDALEIERAVLVGHSMGGLVAARTALGQSERISALCLVSSGGLGRFIHPGITAQTLPGVGEACAAFGQTIPGAYQRAWGRAFLLYAPWSGVPPEWVDEQRRLMTLPGFANAALRTRRAAIDLWGQRELVIDELHRLQVPTLVVWGGSDVVVPVSHGYAAAAALPDGRLEVLPGCGHMPHVEAPTAFVDALSRFLVDLGAREGAKGPAGAGRGVG